ncbi:hypothetical protein, partial [Salmonella enterica]|uniref:hypothetical protein n=1 Tax=Salmonella enterica TaxID=28901 RepID=UPI0011BE749E
MTSSDANATLPADYTFAGSDGGTHTMTGLVLKTTGSHSVTATDTGVGTVTGVQSGIVVTPAGAAYLTVGGIANSSAGTTA